MDRPPPERNRPLADILADPATEWSDIREGIRKQRLRGAAAATTNVGVVEALKESLRESAASGATASLRGSEWSAALRGSERSHATAVTEGAIPGDDDEESDAERKRRLLGAAEGGKNNERRSIRKPSRAMVRGREIEEVAFADPSEGEGSVIAFTDSGGLDSSEEKKLEGDDNSRGSRIRESSFGGAQRKPSTRRASRRVSFDAEANDDELASAKATRGEPRRRPPRRRPSRMSSSDRLIREDSISLDSLFRSDSRISLGSVDVMDFGVDNTRPSVGQGPSNSSRSLALDDGGSMSQLVDSDGFLDWGNDSGGSRDSRASAGGAANGGNDKNERDAVGEGEGGSRRDSLEELKGRPSLSHLVDKEGFLGWGDNSSCSRDSEASDNSVADGRSNQREFVAKGEDADMKGSEARPSLSHLVDAEGFLGWESRDSKAVADSAATSEDENNKVIADGGGKNRRDLMKVSRSSPILSDPVDAEGFLGCEYWDSKAGQSESEVELIAEADKGDDSFPERCESWNIEDYDDPDGGVGSPPPARRCGFLWTVNNSSADRDYNFRRSESKEGIETDDIKRILLKGCPTTEAESPGGSAAREGPADLLRKSLFGGMRKTKSLNASAEPVPLHKSLFGSAPKRRSSEGASTAASADPSDDGYYSRPAIRINREDDVDIGELRRKLLLAGLDKGAMKL